MLKNGSGDQALRRVLGQPRPDRWPEIQKTRPCLVVSPDEINRIIGTVIVAPMTKGRQGYPTRVPVKFKERDGSVALDQIRAVDKSLLVTLTIRMPDGVD